MKTFKSKVGFWYILVVVIFIIAGIAQQLNGIQWVGLILFATGAAFMIDIAFRTYYRITEDYLFIRVGIFKIKVEIKKIVRISETYNPVSSPALSLDRLEILYGNYDTVLISPEDKHGFIAAIQQLNPEVQVRLRKQK